MLLGARFLEFIFDEAPALAAAEGEPDGNHA